MHPYAHPDYAEAFGDGFTPVAVPGMGVTVLERAVPGTSHVDSMGPYPLTPLAAGVDFESGFATLRDRGQVSLVLVTDPFYRPPDPVLAGAFDRAVPYKEHHVHDGSLPIGFSAHHRYEIRRARRGCETAEFDLGSRLGEWCALYGQLVERHGIRGIQAFGRGYFERLCRLAPIAVGAFEGGTLVSAHLWFLHEGHGYSHLAASSPRGYELRAAYAVYDHSIRLLRERGARWIDFGAGAGTGAGTGGLAEFKRGFSHTTRPCLLCGRILDPAAYAVLSRGREGTPFFPAYRATG